MTAARDAPTSNKTGTGSGGGWRGPSYFFLKRLSRARRVSSGRADPDEASRSTVTCSEKNVHSLRAPLLAMRFGDRKSTRLNSSHSQISYAVFCLKKKKTDTNTEPIANAMEISIAFIELNI